MINFWNSGDQKNTWGDQDKRTEEDKELFVLKLRKVLSLFWFELK